jgi:hypothetical protein
VAVIDVVSKFYIMDDWEVVGFVVEGRWLCMGMVKRKWLGMLWQIIWREGSL